MRKVLVMPDGNWLAHVSRVLEIAKALRELRGYHIVFAGEGKYMRLPRECGFEVRPVATLAPDHVLRCSRAGRANWWDYQTVAAHVEADLEVFAQVKPDLVLGDFRLLLSTSCELAGIPLAVTLNAAWTDYYVADVRAPEHFWFTTPDATVEEPLAGSLEPYRTKYTTRSELRDTQPGYRTPMAARRQSIWYVWHMACSPQG